MVDTVSIDTPVQAQEPTFNIDSGSASGVPASPEVASARAAKAQFGLSDLVDKTYGDYEHDILNGNEDSLRRDVASQVDVKKNEETQKVLTAFLNNKNQGYTPDDLAFVQGTVNKNRIPTDPKSVIEDKFAQKYMDTLNWPLDKTDNSSWYKDAMYAVPDKVRDTLAIGSDILAKQEYLRTQAANLTDAINQQSSIGYVADIAKQAFQPYSEAKLRSNVPGTGFFDGGLLGSNLEAQRDKLISLPPDQFKTAVDAFVANLSKDNPALALQFVNAMMGQSSSEKTAQNVFSIAAPLDIYGAAELAVATGSKAVLIKNTVKAVKDMVEGSHKVGTLPPRVVAQATAGNLEEAAVANATAKTINNINGVTNPEKDALEALTSNYRIDLQEAAANPGRYGQEIVNRLQDMYDAATSNFVSKLATVYRGSRMPIPMAVESIVRAEQTSLKASFKGLENSILDISDFRHNMISNTYEYDMNIGQADGTYFQREQTAKNNAKLNGIPLRQTGYSRIAEINREVTTLNKLSDLDPTKEARLFPLIKERKDITAQLKGDYAQYLPGSVGATIEQSGNGWYIKVTKPLNETSNILRDGMLATDQAAIPRSKWFGKWWDASVGRYLRGPAESLSPVEQQQRQIATFGPSVFQQVLKENAEPINKLSGSEWKAFQRLLKDGQKRTDPIDGEQGYFFKGPQEIDSWYLTNEKRPATEREIKAYFAYKHNVESDRIFRAMGSYRNKARLGTEQHQFSILDDSGNSVKSGFIEGIQRKELPNRSSILIVGNKLGEEHIKLGDMMPTPLGKELREAVQKGEKQVFEILHPEYKPLQHLFGDKYIRYVVTDKLETKPLSWENQVPRRGGGHLLPDYDHYIKQPWVERSMEGRKVDRYLGDRMLMPVGNRVLGQQITDHMNEVNRLLTAGDEAGARAFHEKSEYLPMDWEEHISWYKNGTNDQGKFAPARFSLGQKFQVVPKNNKIVDMDNSLIRKYDYIDRKGRQANSFVDATRTDSLGRMNEIEFTGERDVKNLHTIENKNGVYSYEPAEFIDPIVAMNRGLSRIVNSTFMDEYKVFAAENWLRQAEPLLKARLDEIRDAPFHYFMHAGPDSFLKDADKAEVSVLLGNLKKVRDFIGTPSAIDNFLHSTSQALVDSVYGKVGPKSANALATAFELPFVKDPLKFVRSITYNAYMGLFSVKQFFTQATTFSNILAMSPRQAGAGAAATLLHSWTMVNKNTEIISHFDKLISEFKLPGLSSFKPGQFMEARELLMRTGFQSVGGEHAFLDTPLSARVIKNGFNTFLDWGSIPFKLGAGSTRISAWYTAYLEFRQVNPVGRITRDNLTDILGRAAVLDHNMSRASSSILHTGAAAIPGQFFAYDMRLIDMMTGKQLSPMEKARLFGVSSILYGMPVGGLGLFGYPIADYIKEQAQAHGYVPGDSKVSTFFMEGGPAALMQMITGHTYNFSKFGTKGIDALQDMFSGDATWWKLATGASGSMLSGMYSRSSGLMRGLWALATGDPKVFPLKANDLIDPFKEFAVIGDMAKMYAAINTGRLMSKNNVFLDETSPLNSVFSTVTGLSDVRINDAHTKMQYMKEVKKTQDQAITQFTLNFRRGQEAHANRDFAQAEDYFIRANAYLSVGFPEELRAKAFQRAIEGNVSLVSSTDFNYYLRNIPTEEKKMMMDAYQRTLNLEAKNKGSK